MGTQARVVEVEHLGARRLRIVFSDDLVRELDFDGVLTGALSSIDDDEVFGAVEVDRVSGTIGWPGGYDLDPDVLHGDFEPAHGRVARLVREYRLETAG